MILRYPRRSWARWDDQVEALIEEIKELNLCDFWSETYKKCPTKYPVSFWLQIISVFRRRSLVANVSWDGDPYR